MSYLTKAGFGIVILVIGILLVKLGLASNNTKKCNNCHQSIPIKATVCPYCRRSVSYNGALDAGVVKPRGISERLAMLLFGALMVLGGVLCIFSPILSLFS